MKIERPAGDGPESTTFRLLPPSKAPRLRSIDPGEDLGSALKRARRSRKISLAQAARDTRIAVRYLSALERGAPLEEFPAPIHARAFLREYARYLRLETEPVLRLLTPYEPPPVATTLAVLSKAFPRSRERGRLIALAVAAVLSILLVLGAEDPPRRAAPSATSLGGALPAVVPAWQEPAASDVPKGAAAPAGRPTVALSTTARSWLRITVDGAVVYEGTAPAGWSRSFAGDERVDILIGNAAGVNLSVGGRPLGKLGRSGEVRRILVWPGPEGPVVRNLARSG